MRPVPAIAAGVFGVVAIVHLLRLYFGWEVRVADIFIPHWVSILGTLVAGGLAALLWREAGR